MRTVPDVEAEPLRQGQVPEGRILDEQAGAPVGEERAPEREKAFRPLAELALDRLGLGSFGGPDGRRSLPARQSPLEAKDEDVAEQLSGRPSPALHRRPGPPPPRPSPPPPPPSTQGGRRLGSGHHPP